MANNLVKLLVSIILVFVLLIVGVFYYSKSQLRLGLEATNEYVQKAFSDPEKREKLGIPVDVELKKGEKDFVDFGIGGGEVIYPCTPNGHVYVTFTAKRNLLLFTILNRKEDFRVDMANYNPKDVELK